MQTDTDTPRNRRIDTLAGCTPLAVELHFARIGVNAAIARHRTAQHRASKPWVSRFDAKPSSTRAQVRRMVARVRAIEAEIEATYGRFIPVVGAQVQAAA